MRSEKKPTGHGQAMVEFALVIGLILLILMGIFDLGRIVYTATALSNAAREGARVAAVTGDTNKINAAIISTGIGLNIQSGQIGAPVYCLSADCSSATSNRSATGVVAVRISISNYPFTAITPFIGRILGPSDTINLSTSASMTMEKP
jgi:Flp pilus assembly protein TadG